MDDLDKEFKSLLSLKPTTLKQAEKISKIIEKIIFKHPHLEKHLRIPPEELEARLARDLPSNFDLEKAWEKLAEEFKKKKRIDNGF